LGDNSLGFQDHAVKGQLSHTCTSAECQEERDAQLSQRPRCAGCVSFGQKWKTGTGNWKTIFYGHYRSISSTTVI